MLRTFLHFDGDVAVVFEILCQPDCREMAPAKLLDDDVAIKKNLTHMYGMVASNFVIWHSLILA